ncbi:hypothetical protein BJX61DRAFT_542613 [Aspergillus egyptiacus]|nr:hypothetical protein BJX61DRAFT_542613 [Aspergillus egyptiacus]
MGNRQSTEVDRSFLAFCGIRESGDRRGKIWHTDLKDEAPELSVLEDYSLALGPTDTDAHVSVPTRPRVDAILHLLLARSKKKVLDSSNAEKLNTLFWGYEQVITLPETECKGNVRDCALDYVLWYGDKLKLQTNLIVIRAQEPIQSARSEQYLPVLADMSMIQSNRGPDNMNKETYGIFTDGFKWVFLHLNSRNKYSSLILSWNNQQQAIVSQIGRIIDNAVSLKLLCGESGLEEGDQSSTVSGTDSETSSATIDYLESLEMPFRKFFSRRRFTGSDDEKNKNKTQLPIKAVTDLVPQDVEHIFGFKLEHTKSTWKLHPRARRQVPDYLQKMLENYDLAFGHAEKNEALVRSRIDAIVLTTLAAKKREEFRQHGGGKAPGQRTSTQSVASYRSLHWGLERTVKLPWTVNGKRCLLSGKMDYALWYGRRDEGETNMVIVEAKKYGAVSLGRDQVIAYMGMLHHGRKQAGRINTAIYGIATDSYDWTSGGNKQLAIVYLCWRLGDGNEIFSHLHRIMDDAALLSPVPTHILSRQQTVEELSGLRVERVKD